jgi:hypothetical protein
LIHNFTNRAASVLPRSTRRRALRIIIN